MEEKEGGQFQLPAAQVHGGSCPHHRSNPPRALSCRGLCVGEESPAVAAPGPSPGSRGCPNSPCLPDIWYLSPPACGFRPPGTAWLPRDPCMALRDEQLQSEGHQAGRCFLLSVQMGGPEMHPLLLQCPRQQAPAYTQWLPGNNTPSFVTSLPPLPPSLASSCSLRPCYLSPRLSYPQTLLSREPL